MTPYMTPYLLQCMFLVHFNACITPVEMFLCGQMKLTSVNASGLGKIVSVCTGMYVHAHS